MGRRDNLSSLRSSPASTAASNTDARSLAEYAVLLEQRMAGAQRRRVAVRQPGRDGEHRRREAS